MQNLKGFGTLGLIIVISAALGVGGLFGYSYYQEGGTGAPTTNFVRDVLPETDSTYEVGTSSQAFLRATIDELCLTGDACYTSITGGSGATVFGDLGDVSTTTPGTGDIYYLDSTGTIVNLNAGSNGEVLKLSSGIPSWGTDNTGGGGGTFAWTPTDYGVSTSTTLGFTNGFLSTASSTITDVLHADGTIDFQNLFVLDAEELSGTQRLRVQGTGANDPVEFLLQPKGSSNSAIFSAINSSNLNNFGDIELGIDANRAFIHATSSGTGTTPPIDIVFDGTTRARFDTNGNVGIGTTTPTSDLHVYDTSVSGALNNLITAEWISSSPADNDQADWLELFMADSNGDRQQYARIRNIAQDVTAGTEDGRLQFSVVRNGTLEEALSIDQDEIIINDGQVDRNFVHKYTGGTALQIIGSTGFVGIGTTDPSTQLDVQGTASSTNVRVDTLTAGQPVAANGSKNLVSTSTISTNFIENLSGTNTGDVTLAGALDYLTLSGQQITRNAIDLTTDVTGTLSISNGGTGQTSFTNNTVLTINDSGAFTASSTVRDFVVDDALTISSSGSVDWTALTSYPTGCTNQFVTAVGDTLTCATVTSSDVDSSIITSSSVLNDLSQTSLADPNADQLVFWDDTDTQFEFISTLTGLTITGNTLSVDTVDFSDGTNATAGDGITFTGDQIDADLGTAIDTTEITDDTILEADLDLVDTPSDEECLTYESGAGGDFEWQSCGGGSVAGNATEIQFNDFGVFGASSLFTFATSTETLSIGSGGADSVTQYGQDADAWSVGFDITDKSFAIASSTTLGTENYLTLTKSGGYKLNKLTSNGFVKTSGGDGTLSIDTSTYLTSVAPTDLNATDFGDFTCNGSTCSLDTGTVADNEIDYTNVTLNDLTFDVNSVSKTEFGYLNGVTSAIQTQLNAKLEDITGESVGDLSDVVSTTPNSGDVLIWDGADSYDNGSLNYSQLTVDAGDVDFSADTNATAGTGITFTNDEIAIDEAGNLTWTGTHDFTGGSITQEFRLMSVTIASTSVEWVNGGQLPAISDKDGFTLTEYSCWVESGTSVVVNLSDGTNDTETITCTTGGAQDTDVATNDTFTANEQGYLEIGAITGAVDYLHFEAYGTVTR